MADTLLSLIQEYREQMAINNATDCEAYEEDALAEATFRPSYNRLCTNPPAATSLEEVAAAIRLVADEEENCGGQPDLTVNVLRAALAFFDAKVSEDAKLVELGQQFEVAKAKARPLEKQKERLYAEAERLAGIAGLTDRIEDRPAHGVIRRRCGYEAASNAFLKAHDEAVRLMRAIHRTKATTLEGFAVKAAAVAFDQADFEVDVPVPSDVAERELYRLARDMAKVVKGGGRP